MNAVRRLLQPSDPARFPKTPYILGAICLASVLALAAIATPASYGAAAAILVIAILVAGMATLKSASLHPGKALTARTGLLAAASAGLLVCLGMVVGGAVSQAQSDADHRAMTAALFSVIQQMRETGQHGRAAKFEADRIDSAVEHWVRDREEIANNPLRRAYLMLPGKASFHQSIDKGIVRFAERRLEKFGGDAAAWKVTAQYCRDLKGPNPLRWDLKQHYESTAAAYSKLLGRPITAEHLMPAVPNGYCD